MISKVYQVSDDEFRKIVAQAHSYSDCLRALGLGTRGGSSTDVLKRRIKELDCSISHFSRTGNASNAKYTLDEILVENSSYANITRLKSRLINEGRMEYKCANCGNEGEWMGQKLTLQLDHINGKNNDHRIENLRFLCPNCHSITDTYAGKNKNI
jgi:5-methylcytosine-specific restriction endonuclease McrA